MDTTNQLRQLFPGLEEDLYEEMEAHGDIKEISAGTVLLRKGQVIRSTMLVLEGVVKLYQEDDEGNSFFMYDIEPGEACAVSMVCTYRQENSQVVARAASDLIMLSIPIEYMDRWLGKFKSWHYFVIRTWRARYGELLNTINEIAFKNMDERLLYYLQAQVKKHGMQIRLTHQEIATDLNSSREVISRLLKKMEKNGWITLHRNSMEWIKRDTGTRLDGDQQAV